MHEPDPDTRPSGGEVRPRLDRAPAERYAASGGAGPASGHSASGGERRSRGTVRALLAAATAALGGAGVFFVLGLRDIGVGTLAAAAAAGWAVALALIWGGETGSWRRPARMAIAGGLAAGAVTLGLLLGWAWAVAEGGVLPPLSYLDQRYGPLAWLNVLVAAVVAAWRTR